MIPSRPLATSASRAVLPETYTRRAAVSNVQCMALLTAGFAQGNEELVRAGMHDWLHEPFRAEVCPLLPAMRNLRDEDGVLGVVLSGAGPSVLVLCRSEESAAVKEKIRLLVERVEGKGETEVAECRLNTKGLQAAGNGVPLW